jgi:hypothetical protein
VDCGDGRLELVGAELRSGEGVGDEYEALLNELLVPPGAVLLLERDQRAVGPYPGHPPRLRQQHQRE